jgi:hypothetical protein
MLPGFILAVAVVFQQAQAALFENGNYNLQKGDECVDEQLSVVSSFACAGNATKAQCVVDIEKCSMECLQTLAIQVTGKCIYTLNLKVVISQLGLLMGLSLLVVSH